MMRDPEMTHASDEHVFFDNLACISMYYTRYQFPVKAVFVFGGVCGF